MMTRGFLHAAVVTAGVVIGTQVWAGEGWVKDSINGCKMWTEDVEVGKVFSWSGSCVDDKASGNGVLVVFGDGEVLVRYRGTMEAGKADGVGLVEFKTDQGYVKYLGEVKNSTLNGQGVLERPDGARYAGSFVDDEPDGLGSYHAKNGATYHGEFKAGKPHGRGSDRRADGEEYIGTYANGVRAGQGTAKFADGDSYTGEFKNGEPDGKGRLRLKDGAVLVGTFRAGKAEGPGRYTAPNGDVFLATFGGDVPEGEVKITRKDGTKEMQVWKDGKRVE